MSGLLQKICQDGDDLRSIERLQTLRESAGIVDESLIHVQFVPGRIEVLGKHTDYAGGESITCASRRGIAALVSHHPAPSLVMEDHARSSRIELLYGERVPGPFWAVYPSTVLRRMIRHFGMPSRGIKISMESDLPTASGLSSSSSLIITVLLALLQDENYAECRDKLRSLAALSGFASALESGAGFMDFRGDRGVGTRGGSQDHTAILMSCEDALGLYAYEPVEKLQTVSFPEDLAFVIGGSGVKARKRGEAKRSYNLASQNAARLARLYSKDVGETFKTMGSMMASPNFDRDSLRHCITDESLWDRFCQFERECGLVLPRAIESMEVADWATFGKMCDESQKMAAELLGNQITETNDMVRSARELGALGASSFGAGFGGSVWALTGRDDAEDFAKKWEADYRILQPRSSRESTFFIEYPSPAAWVQS